ELPHHEARESRPHENLRRGDGGPRGRRQPVRRPVGLSPTHPLDKTNRYTQSVPPRVCSPHGHPGGTNTTSFADTSIRSPSSSNTPRPEIVRNSWPTSSVVTGMSAPG